MCFGFTFLILFLISPYLFFFFNNGKPKILFQETPLGNNKDNFNENEDDIHNTIRSSLKIVGDNNETQFLLCFLI
jgi:hypothetical protein